MGVHFACWFDMEWPSSYHTHQFLHLRQRLLAFTLQLITEYLLTHSRARPSHFIHKAFTEWLVATQKKLIYGDCNGWPDSKNMQLSSLGLTCATQLFTPNKNFMVKADASCSKLDVQNSLHFKVVFVVITVCSMGIQYCTSSKIHPPFLHTTSETKAERGLIFKCALSLNSISPQGMNY